MLGDILLIVLVLWLLGAVAPLNSGRPYIAFAGSPSLSYIVVVLLVVLLIVHYLVPSIRSL